MNNYKIVITHTLVISYMLVMDRMIVQHTQWQKPPYATGYNTLEHQCAIVIKQNIS